MDSTAVLFLAGLFLLLLGCIAWNQPRVTDRVWHWHQTITGLEEAPDRFYAQVHQGLQAGLQVRHLPLGGMGFGPSTLFETRSILHGRPLYLEARYKHATFYLYAAPTPAGFFVSEWMFSKYITWMSHPILKWFSVFYFSRQTLFQFDAVLMFGESIHATVLQVLDTYLEEADLQPLDEFERRPILHAFYSGTPGAMNSGVIGSGSGTGGAGGRAQRLPL